MEDHDTYRLGREGNYSLTTTALEHIIHGDFSIRPGRNHDGRKTSEKILTGGLHTWAGWTDFLSQHNKISHLADFDTDFHSGWYYARELQNGVITLKIPRELFSKDAANITMMPDVNYRSGYLWKTLFPRHYGREDILNVIREALINIDEEDSMLDGEQKLIIGYARTLEPFTAIRIRVQLQGTEIRSAFPTWDQPFTGNNGKPYSHEHSISFQLAASTIGAEGTGHRASRVFVGDGFDFPALMQLTPKFLLTRRRPNYNQIQDDWHTARRAAIAEYVSSIADIDVNSIVNYLRDYAIAKQPFHVQCNIYRYYLDFIEKYPGVCNAVDIAQNSADCFYALTLIDNKNGTFRLFDAARRFLAMGVCYAGGLDTLEMKRLVQTIIECAMLHHSHDSATIIIDLISTSPLRAALFTEFNVNPFIKTNDEIGIPIIGHPGVTLSFSERHLIDFVSTSLGENYLLNFSKEERKKIAIKFISENYTKRIISDSLLYFRGSDFDFFSYIMIDLMENLNPNGGKTLPSEGSLVSITREYSRMLVAYRQRIVMEDLDAYGADPYEYDFGSIEHFEIMKQQHKRTYVHMLHEMWLTATIEFSKKVNYTKLEKRAEHLLGALSKERVPLPKRIPDHIRSWMHEPKYKDDAFRDFTMLV
jgi:hypothetical protein